MSYIHASTPYYYGIKHRYYVEHKCNMVYFPTALVFNLNLKVQQGFITLICKVSKNLRNWISQLTHEAPCFQHKFISLRTCVRIESQLDLGAKETLTIHYNLQNMHKIVERLKFTYTHEVNNKYYNDYPIYKYVQKNYTVQQGKKHEVPEAIQMHTSIRPRFDPQTPQVDQ